MALEFDPPTLDLMRRIKKEFDPNGILNPGKLLPD
jgi:D-lactate dehydrogenase